MVNVVSARETSEERALALFKEHSGKIERGVREAQPRTIRKLAGAIGVEPQEFIEGDRCSGRRVDG
jgi:hypothetical protein